MATDPNQLLGVLLGTVGQGQNIINGVQNNALQQQAAQNGIALQGQQQQINAQQIAAADQDQAQQAQYGQDVAAWTAQGAHADGLSTLIAKYPKQWQALQQSWKAKNADVSQADLRTYGSVFNALDNNSPEVALAELRQRRDAEAKAGIDTSEIDQHIEQIAAGDPNAINAVKGWARAQVAAASGALGDANLAKSVGVDVDSDRYKAISGKGVFDTRTGQYVEGGDPASDGGAGDGSTGPVRDTSRILNTDAGGGSIPDSVKTVGQFIAYGKALNAKGAKSSSAGTYQINGSTMAQFAPQVLGADWRNQPFNADSQDKVGEAIFDWAKTQPNPADALRKRWVSLSPAKAAQLVQGSWNQAKGTIAAGETGGAPGASANAGGLGAARAVGGYSAAAIDSMARADKLPAGIPKDVRAAVINRKAALETAKTDDSSTGDAYLSTLTPGRANLLRAINDGRAPAPKPGSRFGQALSEDLARAFPQTDATQFAVKQKTRQDFTGNGKAAQTLASYNRFAAHLNDAWGISQRLAGPNLGFLSGPAAGALQSFSPRDVNDYNTAIDGIQGEFQKLTKNGVANESEAARLIYNARAAQSTEGRIGALKSMAKLVAGAYQPQVSQWHSAFPDKPLPVDVTPQAKAAINNVIHNGKVALPTDKNGAPIGHASGFVPEGRAQFSHMSASGKFGWNGKQWVAVH